jgi:hypothetical protein
MVITLSNTVILTQQKVSIGAINQDEFDGIQYIKSHLNVNDTIVTDLRLASQIQYYTLYPMVYVPPISLTSSQQEKNWTWDILYSDNATTVYNATFSWLETIGRVGVSNYLFLSTIFVTEGFFTTDYLLGPINSSLFSILNESSLYSLIYHNDGVYLFELVT